MRARGISEKPESSIIKRLTPLNNSIYIWQKETQILLTIYNYIDQELIEGNKRPLKRSVLKLECADQISILES